MSNFITVPGIVPDGKGKYNLKDITIEKSTIVSYNELSQMTYQNEFGGIVTLSNKVTAQLTNSAGPTYINMTLVDFEAVVNPPIPFPPNVVQVLNEDDIPTNLVANTTYVVNGFITISKNLNAVVEGCSIIGRDRAKDGFLYTGVGPFISVRDVNFSLSDLKLSASDINSQVLSCLNYTSGAYNEGRDKVFTMVNCQIRNCYNVMSVEGFDLCDIQNSLFWYIQATSIGCQFKNVSKLQFTSCEFVRWFDEAAIPSPTPADFATVPMVELLANGAGAGFGATNLTGCIFHPQQTQDGVNISNASTTGFGTISSNTFISIGLTTGSTYVIDYDIQNGYVIQANQSVPNDNAYATMSLTGNTVYLDNSTTNPIVLKDANTVGGVGFTNPIAFPTFQRVITSVADASITYNSRLTGTFFVNVNATVQMSGNGTIYMRLRANGVAIPSSIGSADIKTGAAETLSFSIIGTTNLGDVFDIEVESSTGADVLISEFSLNGYQL